MKLGFSGFFRDIQNFFKGGTVLGTDIGTASIKITELSKRGDSFALSNYGILETKKYLDYPTQAIQTSSLRIVEGEATRLLKTLLSEMKTKSHLAITSIPLFTTFVTVFEMPKFSKEETHKVVMFQAQQYIPMPLEQVSVEWSVIEEFDTEQGQKYQRVLLIGIPNDVIEKYKKIHKDAGLRLVSMEVDVFAILRALGSFLTDVPTLIVDIGAQSTNIMVVEGKVIRQASQTDYSGIYLTQAISKSLDVSMIRAEELKRRKGLSGTGVDSELSTLLLPFLDVIIQEVRHAKDVYERRYTKKIEKLMLIGGGANLIGIEKYFSSQIGLTIAHQSLLMGIQYPETLRPVEKNLDNELAVSFGLGKRYFL